MSTFLHQTGFFEVTSLAAEAQQIEASVRVNPDHPLFAGHFPNQPIVPGVCLYQLLSEVTMLAWHTPLRLAKGHSVKFLHLVPPGQTELTISLQATRPTPDTVHVSGTLRTNGEVVCKANLSFSLD